MNGLLVVDKAAGMTSHDVVGRVRRASGVKRVGHAGTLDPDATGVLVVCIGPSTRLADFVADQGKRYRCTLVLGATTDTEDSSGDTLAETDASHVTQSDIEAVLGRFVGEIEQVPPMVSAVHHEGKRLYELARKGITVERAPRTIRVDTIQLTDFTPGARPMATLEIACGKGAYVRTLCADIGAALGVGGHMGTLRRTAVGRFTEGAAIPVADLTGDTVLTHLLPPREAVESLPTIRLADSSLGDDIVHGRSIPGPGFEDGATVAILDADGRLIALANGQGGALHPAKVFPVDDTA